MRPTLLYSTDPVRGWLPWGVLAVVLCLLFVVIPTVGVSELLLRFGLVDEGWQPVGLNGLFAFLLWPFAATGLLLLVWVRLVERRPLASIGLTPDGAGPRWLGGVAAGLITAFAVVMAIWMAGGYRADGWLLAWASPVALGGIGFLLLCFAVQAGVEEILFRGWLMSVLGRKFNTVLAVLITSVVFTALHYGRQTPWHESALIFLFSLFACCWALRAGNIWGVMGWHTGWNWLLAVGFAVPVTGLDAGLPALLVKLLPQGSPFLHGGAQGPEGSALCGLFFVLGCAWWLLRGQTRAVAQIEMNYRNELR